MKAMILAAGLGTRLRPLTDDRPKALVTVAGHTLLELTLVRLLSFGIREVIINTHHFGDMIADHLRTHNNFDMRIAISREEVLLDTGGGLKNASHFFLDSVDPDKPFLLHNVDVLSTIDISRMLQFHEEHNAIATLAVQDRPTSRYLLFDKQNRLCGRRGSQDVAPEFVRPCAQARALAFSGIHILSPRIFSHMHEEGIFSIIPSYLRLAAQDEIILAFSADEYYWRDLGRPSQIEEAARDIADGTYPV